MKGDAMAYVIGLLVAVLAMYYILAQGFATQIPTDTAITIVGINFSWIILLSVIVGLLYALMRVVKTKDWK